MGFRQPLTRRVVTGSYVRGKWAEGAPADTTIFGSVQPAPGRVRNQDIVGIDSSTAMLLITETRLNTVESAGTGRADQIFYDGDWYRIVSEERWQNSVIPHYEYIMAVGDD